MRPPRHSNVLFFILILCLASTAADAKKALLKIEPVKILERGKTAYELKPDGALIVGSKPVGRVRPDGRVVDKDSKPLLVLRPDGTVLNGRKNKLPCRIARDGSLALHYLGNAPQVALHKDGSLSLAGFSLAGVKTANQRKLASLLLCLMVSGPAASPPLPLAVQRGEPEARKLEQQIIAALKRQDLAKLAELVHPQKGLRITPPANGVDLKRDVVLKAKDLRAAKKDKKIRSWGLEGTSDIMIKLTISGYFKKWFRYHPADQRVFMGVRQENLNPEEAPKVGEVHNNIKKNYPGAIFIEWYAPGTEKNGYYDWGSDFLIMERYQGKLYLVGLMQDFWTP